MATIPWFKQTVGLNDKIDPGRLVYTEKDGVLELAEAYNVDIGESGDISRRLGYTTTAVTASSHSLFCDGGVCLFVTGGALCVLAEDMSYTPIRNVTTGVRMSYCQMGDVTYYMNGSERGVVKNGSSWSWDKPSTVRYPDSTRVYIDPPTGSIVKSYAGRVWIAKGNVLWYSEPFLYNTFNAARGYIAFPGKIVMVAPVIDGIYVSTEAMTYFIQGADPNKMQLVKVSNYGAIIGTDVTVDGIAVNNGKYSSLLMPMWTTNQGICLGLQGGQVANLTYDRLTYPRVTEGGAVYTGKRYIVTLGSQTVKLGISLALSRVAISQYGNYNFNSMCKFGSKLLGANESGIFVLESGDDDSGTDISAFFKLGPTDFGIENEKRLRRSYISGRLDGRLRVTMSGDEGEEVEQSVVPSEGSLRLIHHEVRGGRDIRGKYLSFKVANVLGSDFTISNINAVLIVLGQNAKEGV